MAETETKKKSLVERWTFDPDAGRFAFNTAHGDEYYQQLVGQQAARIKAEMEIKREYRVLPKVKAEDLEAAVNGLVAEGWHDIRVRAWLPIQDKSSDDDAWSAALNAAGPLSLVEAWRVTGGPAYDLVQRVLAEQAAEVE